MNNEMLQEMFDECYTIQGRYLRITNINIEEGRWAQWVFDDLSQLLQEKFDTLLVELEKGIGTISVHVNSSLEFHSHKEKYEINKSKASIRNLKSEGTKAVFRNLYQ